jgi:hypothetical protein
MSSYENEAPSGVVADDSYVSGSSSKNEGVPVVSDETNVEDPMDEGKADSDEQLGTQVNHNIASIYLESFLRSNSSCN